MKGKGGICFVVHGLTMRFVVAAIEGLTFVEMFIDAVIQGMWSRAVLRLVIALICLGLAYRWRPQLDR